MNTEIKKSTYKVISRTTGLTEFEGAYSECKSYLDKEGFNLSILKIEDPIWDEDGNYNAIESN